MKSVSMFMVVLAVLGGLSVQGNAALCDRGADSLGNHLIYDSDLNITWYDYSKDYDNWQNQVNWASGLTVTFGGNTLSGWRLPKGVDGRPIINTNGDPRFYNGTGANGYNITSGEMGYLFYTELGNKGYYGTDGTFNQPGWGLQNKGPFQHLRAQSDAVYWSSAEYAVNRGQAWAFSFCLGFLGIGDKISHFYALAVRDGDVLPPTPPIANAGPDQTVQAGAVVQLDGSNSSSSVGIVSYQWAQLSGPQVILSDPTVAQPTFTAPIVGANGASLQFQLMVTDKNSRTAQATCTVTVTFVNQPPVAKAGNNQTVNAGDFMTLNGSGSTDPDNGIATFFWQQTGGPTVQLSDQSAVSPTFTAPVVGTEGTALTFKLTITDMGGLTSTSTCIVNVSWVNQPPAANAGESQTVWAGDSVGLTGSGSNDADDGVATYSWQQLSGLPVTLSDPAAANPTFTAPRVVPKTGAMLTFQLTVTDKGGLKSTATNTVNVHWLDTPPTVNAGNNRFMLSVDQYITVIAGTATDADNDPLSYTWFEGDTALATGLIGADGKAILNLSALPLLSLGAHTLTLVVDDGYMTSQKSMLLTVENSPPTVAPSGEGTYQVGTSVTLGGQVTDYDGDTVSYTWFDGTTVLRTGAIATVKGGAPVNLLSFITSGLKVGAHAITLQADDGVNDRVAKTFTVTIIDTAAPTIAPVADQTILWPPIGKMVPVTIQANASDNSGMSVRLSVAVACNESGTAFWTTPVINETTGVISLSLQSARAGNNKDGRQYTVTITATDQSGNASTANVKIVVPHDQGK